MKHKLIKTTTLTISLILLVVITINVTLAYIVNQTKSVKSTFIPYITNKIIINKYVEHPFGEDYIVPQDLSFDFIINFGSNYANKEFKTSLGILTSDADGIINISIKPNDSVYFEELEDGIKANVTEVQNRPGFTAKSDKTFDVDTSISDGTISLDFTNTYSPSPALASNIVINGIKELEGRDWQENDEFTFALEYKTEQDEWIQLGTKTITYDESKENYNKFSFTDTINSIEFSKLGRYNFRISEVIGNLDNMTYDNTINYFDIIVTDNNMDGALEINNIIGSQNIEVNNENNTYNLNVTFNNTFEVEETKIAYTDETLKSLESEGNIIVNDATYTIDTILSKFDGLTTNYTYKVFDKNNKEQSSKLVRTGDYLQIKVNDKTYKYTLILKGDVNGDGKITPLDYVKIKNHIMETSIISESIYKIAADYNNDTKISPLDYVKVKNYIMNGGN